MVAGEAPAATRDFAQCIRTGASAVVGKEAVKGNVLKLLARPGLFFFATHGSNNPDCPLQTLLLMHGDQADDQLTARGSGIGQHLGDVMAAREMGEM